MPLAIFSRASSKKKLNKEENDDRTSNPTPENRIDSESIETKNSMEANSSTTRRNTGRQGATKEMTWKQAHRETCLSQSTLYASIQEVIDDGHLNLSDHPDGNSSDVLLWGERQKACTGILEQFQRLHLGVTVPTTTTTTTTTAGRPAANTSQTPVKSVFSRAASLAMLPFDVLTSPFAGEPSDYDLPPTEVQQNNDFGPPQKFVMVGMDEPIVNTELTLQCLEFLKTLIQRNPPQILSLSDSSGMSVHEWILDTAKKSAKNLMANLIVKLPKDQLGFLLEILVSSGVVQKIPRQEEQGKPDLIVFPDPNSLVEVRLAVYDLQEAMDHLHVRAETMQRQALAALRAAKIQKQQNNTKAALYQVQRKKLLQQEIDTTYGHLTNLEQQKLALERTGNTHRIKKAMEVTAETLKNLRLSKLTPSPPRIETTQDLVDNLNDELQRVEDDNLALNIPVDIAMADVDEEELLKELASYPDNDPPKEEKEPEEDIDVDDLLEEMQLLQVKDPGTPKLPNKSAPHVRSSKKGKKRIATKSSAVGATIAASVYGDDESRATKEPKTPSVQRQVSSGNKKKDEAKTKVEPKPAKPLLASVYGSDSSVEPKKVVAADSKKGNLKNPHFKKEPDVPELELPLPPSGMAKKEDDGKKKNSYDHLFVAI